MVHLRTALLWAIYIASRGNFLLTFQDNLSVPSSMEKPLSLKRLSAQGLWGGLLYWGPWVMKGRLWGQASIFMGAQLGNLEWAHLHRTLRDG
jgi:hypothetical protein